MAGHAARLWRCGYWGTRFDIQAWEEVHFQNNGARCSQTLRVFVSPSHGSYSSSSLLFLSTPRKTWPHSSCFTNWVQPPIRDLAAAVPACCSLIKWYLIHLGGRTCSVTTMLISKTVNMHRRHFFFFFSPPFIYFFLNWVTEFICRLPERRRGESRWVVGKWCEGASARVSVKSAVGGRKSKEKFCAFTLWRSRWEEGGFFNQIIQILFIGFLDYLCQMKKSRSKWMWSLHIYLWCWQGGTRCMSVRTIELLHLVC